MSRRAWSSLLLAILGFPLIVYLGLRLGFATPLVNLALKKELGGLFNGEVKFGSFRTDLLNYAEINDLLVLTTHGESKVPVLTAGRIRLNYDGWQLLNGGLQLEDAVELLSIRSLRVFLLRDLKGRWNLRQVLKLPEGRKKVKKDPAAKSSLPPLATRLVLEDSIIVFNDERRGFQSTLENVEGTLDARAFPLVAFSLSGRTEDQEKENLSLAGEWNAEADTVYARADLDYVPLSSYLNYALPAGGLQFLSGTASVSLRVQQKGPEAELDFAGRANVHRGSLAIPGISDPLTSFEGDVLFGDDTLKVNGVTAAFLGSTWRAQGELNGLRKPELNLVLENDEVALQPLSEQIHGLKALSLSGTASLSLTMTGRAADPVVQGRLHSASMELAGISLQDVDAGVRLTKRGLSVPELKGRLWDGSVKGSAELRFPSKKNGDPQGGIDAELSAQGVQLAQIRYKGVEYLPLSGSSQVKATVKGALTRPHVEARLDCGSAFFGSHPLGSLGLGAVTEGKRLDLALKTWRGKLNANVGFDFEAGARFVDSKAVLKGFPLDELMRAVAESPDTALIGPALRAKMALQLQRYSGNADLEMGISGMVKTPDLSLRIFRHEGHWVVSDGFFSAKSPKGIDFSARGLMRLGPDGLKFGEGKEPFRIGSSSGGHAAEARLLGRLPVKALQDADKDGLELTLNADLGVLDQLQVFNKTRGTAELDLKVGGKIDALLVSGWLQLKDMNSEMDRYLSKIKNGEAEIWVKDQSVTIENLSFESGGAVEANGRLDFSSGARPHGRIEVRSDQDGLALNNFDYGDLHVALEPLSLAFLGNDGMSVSGKAMLHDSVIRLPRPKPKVEGARLTPLGAPYPVNFELRAEIDENVWLKKIQEGVEFSDPITMLRGALSSAQETLQSPAFEFLFKPTDIDFEIRGVPPNLKVAGELGIDRGTLIFMENEFKIRQETKANRVSFRSLGRVRADVDAQAVAQIRYVRELPGGKIEPKTVRVTVNIKPFTEDELVEAHLENALLNYNLKEFSSDPPLSDNRAQEREAILSLLVLGDPLNQSARDAIGSSDKAGASSASVNQLLSIQASRILSGELRKVINRYAKVLGSQVVDYVRVAPRLRYQGGGGATQGTQQSGTQQSGLSQQIQQEGFRLSWLFELGRSIGKDFYTSGQLLLLGDDDIKAAKDQNTSQVPKDVRNWGARFGAEYRFTPTRLLELSYGYSADENLDPVAYEPDKLWQAHQGYVGIRNTIPTDNYNPRIARQRHIEMLEAKERDE